MSKNGSVCTHHWCIDSPENGIRGKDNRFYVDGWCSKCSATRSFISEFADVDYAGMGSHQLGTMDIDTSTISQKYDWKPRDVNRLTANTRDAKLTKYEVEGCGYDCVDSLNCPYKVCIHDDSRVARLSSTVALLSTHQRASYIRSLGKKGYVISEIISMTGIPYRIVWRALSTNGYKATLPEHDQRILRLRKKGYSYDEIADIMKN